VTIVVTNRERDNELSSMFNDEFVDPIIDELNLLQVRVLDMIKMLDEELHASDLNQVLDKNFRGHGKAYYELRNSLPEFLKKQAE